MMRLNFLRSGRPRWWLVLMALASMSAVRAVAPAARLARPESATHLVFVVDTSSSLRDRKSGRLPPGVFQSILSVMLAQDEMRAVQMFDTEGRRMLAPRDEWRSCTPETLLEIERALERAPASTLVNPVAGITQAIRRLPVPEGGGARLQLWVIGETFVSQSESVLCRLDDANPADGRGLRRASINVMQLGLPGRKSDPSSEAFRSVMSAVAQQHGGTFRRLESGQ